MLKMATYPGMSLGGEVRESISLDEDDLSDVEDEVFIRDGKNSYKLAEELNVKRPLMAPRRKLGKPDFTTRLRARPPCRAFCRPCCYIFAALSLLIGLIALVVVLVSIFPLPLDRLRDWVISKARPTSKTSTKLVPCSSLNVTDVWVTNLPVLTTESPVRTLDIDHDGVDDIIFGFGTGDNYNILPPDVFCPIFLGVAPPCEGGVIALNGTTGDIAWRYWVNDTIFSLNCNADVNEDGLNDCLAIGVEGTIQVIDSRNGSLIWRQNNSKMDILVANFVPDLDNDNVSDILSSHSTLNGKDGHIVLISGKTGKELKRIATPNSSKTFYMPQLLQLNDSYYLTIIGTGSPNSPGNLSIVPLDSLLSGNLSFKTIYEDRFKGVLTQSVLVDITGDSVPDIVTAMYNSTVVAIDGKTFRQIWNSTIPNSESNVVATPGYFNDDNVTDFLVVYQLYDNILNYNYTKTFIIDGKTGKLIYDKPIEGSVMTQMGGLTLSMESYGFDMFLFWTTECPKSGEVYKSDTGNNFDSIYDVCQQRFNATSIMKLNALNQYDQPPGFQIYNSATRTLMEFNNIKSALKQVKDYIKGHPKIQVPFSQGQTEVDETYRDDSKKIRVHKYGTSSFRHKDNKQGIVKNYMDNYETANPEEIVRTEGKFDTSDYEWQPSNQPNALPGDMDTDFNNNYNMEESDSVNNLFNQKQMVFGDAGAKNNRDPRSKAEELSTQAPEEFVLSRHQKSRKKNLPDARYGVYDYENVRNARNRLLHDLNNSPADILKDTYFKNRESQLRKSKFEQRDINSHIDKMNENEEVKMMLEKERETADNTSYNLWNLESEKEAQDRQNGYWRGKREVNYTLAVSKRISSVGAIVNSVNASNSSMDVIFVTYWQPAKGDSRGALERDLDDCIREKLSSASEDRVHSHQKTTTVENRVLFMQECITERENLKSTFDYFNEIYQLRLGQMTVYRIRVECACAVSSADERCANFLQQDSQSWPTFLGRNGDGVFRTRN